MKKRKIKKILMIVLLFTAAVYCGADETGDLGHITVEGRPVEEAAITGAYGSSTSVFYESAIKRKGALKIDDIIDDVSGVYIQESGLSGYGIGTFNPSLLKIRGLGNTPNTGILLIFDKRPQFMGLFKHSLLDTISLIGVESITVVKGPAGAQYGNQAASGVIEVRSKRREKDGVGGYFTASGGNYFTQSYGGMLDGKNNIFDFKVMAAYSSTAGHRANADSYIQEYSANAGVAPSENIRVSSGFGYCYVRGYNPGPEGAAWDREQEAFLTNQRRYDLSVENKFDYTQGSLIIMADSGQNKFLKQKPGPVLIPGGLNKYENYGALIEQEFTAGFLRVKAGFDWMYYSGYFENYPPVPAAKVIKQRCENDYSPYVLVNSDFKMAEISAGLRYYASSMWNNDFIPQASLRINYSGDGYAYLSYNKGFKTPAMGQLIFAQNADVYETLLPEKYYQYETGIENIFQDFLKTRFCVYQIEGSNLIKTDASSNVVNSGAVLIRGVEGDIWFDFGKTARAGAVLSYSDPGEKTAMLSYFTGKVYGRVKTGGFIIKAGADFSKERFDLDGRKAKLADYITLNCGVVYETVIFGFDTTIRADAENLLDAKYYLKTGYPAPGFNINSGIVTEF